MLLRKCVIIISVIKSEKEVSNMYQNNLSKVIKEAGLSLSKLSKHTHIDIKALKRYLDLPLEDWNKDDLVNIQTSLGMSMATHRLSNIIRKPAFQYIGGKSKLLKPLIKYMPDVNMIHRYYEPFIGGGALMWRLAFNKCTINDFNPDLTNVYKQLKNHYLTPAPVYFSYPASVGVKDHKINMKNLLKYFETKNTKQGYYGIRNWDRSDKIKKATPLERACRFIFLNKAGFNGMMRYNSKHQENIPWSHTKHINLDPTFLINDAKYLHDANVTINTGDYWQTIKNAQRGDFVYCDPPYIKRNEESFTGYTSKGFGLKSNELLAKHAVQLAKHGVFIELSNANLPIIKKLYPKKYFNIHHVKIERLIGAKASSRKKVGEVIICSNNYKN